MLQNTNVNMASSYTTESGDDSLVVPAQVNDHHYRPIRRINQACNACRRKKSRCTGGRPCRSCRRLSEPCEYPAPTSRSRAAAAMHAHLDQALPSAVTSEQLELPAMLPADVSDHRDRRMSNDNTVLSPRAVTDRLNSLESTLESISAQLGQLAELTRQVCASRAPSIPPSLGPPAPSITAPRQSTARGPSTPGSEWMRGAGPRHMNFVDPFQAQHWAVKMEHLVPEPVMRAVFRDYFKYAHNQPYSFFHERTFWESLDAGLLPDHLLLAVLSHALRFSGQDHFKDRTKSMEILFANMSWKSIVSLYFQERADADLHAVQTITLLSIYDFTAGHDRHDSAWVKIGLAVRMAQDLRLMLDVDDSASLGNAEKEERRRVFWSVYMLDRLASCARARPPAVLEASCHLSLPCEEHLWRAELPSSDYKLDDVARNCLHVNQHPGFPAIVVAMTSILGRCTQTMIQDAFKRSRQAPWDPSSDYATVSSELLTCEVYFDQPIEEALTALCGLAGAASDLPLAGPVVFSRALFLLTHCLLNHPFLLRERMSSTNGKPPQTFLSRALETGHEYAKKMVYLWRDAKNAGFLPHGSFYGYCMVVAGSIHAIGLSSSRASVREEAAACLAICRDTLEYLGGYWRSCESMASHPIAVPPLSFSASPFMGLALKKIVRHATHYTHLTCAATLAEAMEQSERDLLWSVVDYSTLCSAPDGFWDMPSRPASPTSWNFSPGQFEGIPLDQIGHFFPSMPMSGPHDGVHGDGIDYDTIMLPDRVT